MILPFVFVESEFLNAGWIKKNAWIAFVCNSWTNDWRQMKLTSQAFACPRDYYGWVICHGLNRLRWVQALGNCRLERPMCFMIHFVGGSKLIICPPRLIVPEDEGKTIFRNVKHDPTTHHYTPKDPCLHQYRCENFQSHKIHAHYVPNSLLSFRISSHARINPSVLFIYTVISFDVCSLSCNYNFMFFSWTIFQFPLNRNSIDTIREFIFIVLKNNNNNSFISW
jgi:hypothetical protein